MKTKHLLAPLLATCLTLSAAAESVTPDSKLVHIVILDDLTGPELERAHGIRRVTPEDLQVLFDGVALTGLRIQIDHLIIDEDASDTRPTSFRVEALDAKLPDAPNLRIYRTGDETRRLMEAYSKQRAEFHAQLAAYRARTDADSRAFTLTLQERQLEGEQRSDRQLLANGGIDFPRSDVSGHLLAAAGILKSGGAATGILICNSDLDDQVKGRASRQSPLTPEELPGAVVIAFANTSGQPDRSPMLATTPNPKVRAPNMAEVMKRLVERITQPATK